MGSMLHAQTINVSTGVDNSGNALVTGNQDPNWEITSHGASTPEIAFDPSGYWENTPVSGTNAKWINTSGSQGYTNSITGNVTFERSFNVAPTDTTITCDFSLAYDDDIVSLEFVRPDMTTIPLTVVPTSAYQLSNTINNTISTVGYSGTWKIKAVILFTDTFAGFLLSGNINYNLTFGVTNVQNSQCGVTLPSYNSIVYANVVPGAQAYRFKVTNQVTNQVVVKDYVLRNLYMHTLSNFEYNQSYTVEVAVKRSNIWEAYGLPCTITTANAITHVVASQCGSVLSSANTNIYVNIVSAAQGYRFKVTNLTTNSMQLIDKTLRVFNFNEVIDYMDATTYQIEVAVKNTNGLYLSFGPPCTITTPSSSPMRFENSVEKSIAIFDAIAYPNPFNDSFKLELNSTSEALISIAVYDMLGKQLDYKTITSSEIKNFEIGSNLATGVYNVIVSQDENIKSFKMIKR